MVGRDGWNCGGLGGGTGAGWRVAYGGGAGCLGGVGGGAGEVALEEKGCCTDDLSERQATFHAVPGRAVVSLAAIRVEPGDPVNC